MGCIVEGQNRLMTVLTIVLLVLLVPVLVKRYQEKEGGAEEETSSDPDAPVTSKLFSFENKDIQSLELRRASGKLRFEKDGENWKMVSPRELSVEARKVEEIIERFSSTKVEERTLGGALADYGLDETARTEVVLAKADGTTFSVFVGRDTPVGYKSYVKKDETSLPVLATTRLSELAGRQVMDFRSKELWSVSAYDARRVRIEVDGQSVTLRKDGDGWWIGDNGPRADKEKITEWLSGASALKAADFLDGQDPATLGLVNPTAILSVEGGEATQSLRFGTRDMDGAAAQTGSGALVRLDTKALDLLRLSGWESTKLFNDNRYLIEALDLKLGDRSAKYTRQEGTWASSEGKPVSVDAFLEVLEGAAVDRSKADLPAPAESWGTLRIKLGEEKQAVIYIGQQVGDQRVAREEAGGPVFGIAISTLDALAAAMK